MKLEMLETPRAEQSSFLRITISSAHVQCVFGYNGTIPARDDNQAHETPSHAQSLHRPVRARDVVAAGARARDQENPPHFDDS